MVDLLGQRTPTVGESGAVALSPEVNHARGKVVVVLSRPGTGGGTPQHLVLHSEVGSWRLRLGVVDAADMPADKSPGAAVTNGTGSLLLGPGDRITLPGPEAVTVKGFNGKGVLTYWWS